MLLASRSFALQYALSFIVAGRWFGSRLVNADINDGVFVKSFSPDELSAKIPTGLSDFAAVIHGDKVYLSGGCNSPEGNVYNADFGVFTCDSISSALYIFDIGDESFTQSTMPRSRYRHASVYDNNGHVWLVGGRDGEDNIVTAVDAYSIALETWTTFETGLDSKYALSDNAGFAGPNGFAYFTGGYNFTYAAKPYTFAIDSITTMLTNNGTSLVVVPKASLSKARGDLSAVAAIYDNDVPASVADGQTVYAIATGGFTDTNDFCAPLDSTERYNFDDDLWVPTADTLTDSADKALVFLHGRIYALGGERQIENICSVDNNVEPGESTVAINNIEYYSVDDNQWTDVVDLPRHRFRFSAVGYEGKIYSFGGQLAYNKTCQCYPTSNEVIVYTEQFGPAPSPASDGAAPTPVSNGGSYPFAGSLLNTIQAIGLGIILLSVIKY